MFLHHLPGSLNLVRAPRSLHEWQSHCCPQSSISRKAMPPLVSPGAAVRWPPCRCPHTPFARSLPPRHPRLLCSRHGLPWLQIAASTSSSFSAEPRFEQSHCLSGSFGLSRGELQDTRTLGSGSALLPLLQYSDALSRETTAPCMPPARTS